MLVLEHALAEAGAEHREPLADLGEPLPRRRVEPGAGAPENHEIPFQHAGLLGVEAGGLGFERGEPREQGRVHMDGVPVGGQARHDIALEREQRLVAVGADEGEEHCGHPGERPARAFERRDGVGEGRRGRLRRDRHDLVAVLRERRREGRAEMLGRDRGERGRRKRRVPGGEERVRAGREGR